MQRLNEKMEKNEKTTSGQTWCLLEGGTEG